MTSVWVAEHGWVYLMAAIDCCTREIVAWHLETRCRAREAIALIEHAALERGIAPGTLTLGTDNGSAFTARAFKAVLADLGIAHRRGGYRDPESQAFIESWFGKLKERCVWRHEFETLDQAREVIGAYVDPLPPPAPQPARLPHAARGRGDLERWRTDPPNPSGLNRQHGRGARQLGCRGRGRADAIGGAVGRRGGPRHGPAGGRPRSGGGRDPGAAVVGESEHGEAGEVDGGGEQ